MMTEMMGLDMLVSACYALVALLALFLGLRKLDQRAGRPWAETMDIIREDPRATATYYAARWLGACLVVAAFIAR